MSSLNLATDGLLDRPTSLSIATRGLLQNEIIDGVVVVVSPRQGSGGGVNVGYVPSSVTRYQLPDRDELDRSIHKDDEEVLEILIQTILGVL